MNVTLIGDVHQKHDKYFEIIKNTEYSLCLGDFGFEYTSLREINSERNRIIGGNHDNYYLIKSKLYPHFLSDFGVLWDKIFYIRGGFSIDKKYRMIGVDWWEEEELTREECEYCFSYYQYIKPEIVISHEAPREISNLMSNPNVLKEFGFNPDTFTTRTSELLQRCFEYHQPKIWRFGHFHKKWQQNINATSFRCLDELETETIQI